MKHHKPIITRVAIRGLHGDRTITATFASPIKILVDENGSGKTTFLTLLVGLLEGTSSFINRYTFDAIEVAFANEESYTFIRDDLKEYIGSDVPKSIRDILRMFPNDILKRLLANPSRSALTDSYTQVFVDRITEQTGINEDMLYTFLRLERSRRRSNQTQLDMFEKVEDADRVAGPEHPVESQLRSLRTDFPYRILHFPTYRLVEEYFPELRESHRPPSSGEQRIQFGMQDVQARWERMTEHIRRSALQQFSKINGRILDDLTGGIHREQIDYHSLEHQKALEIVLARSGNHIQPHSRTRILQLVESGDIKQEAYTSLAYFLSNLISIYTEQQVIDEAIKTFAHVVNPYLTDKKIVYDETEMMIQVINMRSQTPMPLDTLSSGEKQIISIFTRLHLELDDDTPYAIFFDEPELSLSMEWQRKLLQDIVDSGRCAFLVAATHSPFIFENELAPYADVLTTKWGDTAHDHA